MLFNILFGIIYFELGIFFEHHLSKLTEDKNNEN